MQIERRYQISDRSSLWFTELQFTCVGMDLSVTGDFVCNGIQRTVNDVFTLSPGINSIGADLFGVLTLRPQITPEMIITGTAGVDRIYAHVAFITIPDDATDLSAATLIAFDHILDPVVEAAAWAAGIVASARAAAEAGEAVP